MNNNILIEDIKYICSSACIDFDQLWNSTFLITGATGLVGSMIVRSLLYLNREMEMNIGIVIIARSKDKVRSLFGEKNSEQIKTIYTDLTDQFDVPFPVDFIIHCASNTNSKYMVSNPVETIHISYEGTRQILELAVKKNIKSMVYLSSMEVYGITTEADNPVTESQLGFIDIHNIRSSYSEGKRICELLCSSYHKEYGVSVKIARLAQTFGAGVSATDTRVFAHFARCVIENNDIVLHTKGNSAANYCYTADVIKGILCILTKGESGETYNIVNESASMKIREVAELVAGELSEGTIKVTYCIPDDNIYGYAPDTMLKLSGAKIQSLGWKPQFSLKEMFERLIAYWSE